MDNDYLSGTRSDWMSMPPLDIVAEEMNMLKQRIIDNHIRANQRVTGKTINSMGESTTLSGDIITGKLEANAYFGVLETGSSAWRKGFKYRKTKNGRQLVPAGWFINIIQRWLINKGLSMNAFLVARKIVKKGTRLHQEGGRTDIYTREIPVTLENIMRRVAVFYEATMLNSILRNQETKI